MRHLLVFVLFLFATGAAQAAQGVEPLTKQQQRLLGMVRHQMEVDLKREHARSGDERYQPPRVTLDLNRRNIVITNRFKRNPDAANRRAIKRGLKDHQPALCAALLPVDMRQTLVSIVLRAEMRSGSLIGQTSASPLTCR